MPDFGHDNFVSDVLYPVVLVASVIVAVLLMGLLLRYLTEGLVWFWNRLWCHEDEEELEQRSSGHHRSPVRLLCSVAFERLTDGELLEIEVRVPEVMARLRRAILLLAQSRTDEALNILFVVRTMIRGGFGADRFWLEAIVVSDIAALAHHANQPEDADYYFARAAAIAQPWLARYPWLQPLVTRRRLMRL